MVAQPMLGLSGDFFIELETPWWSPLSDDKWVWPLFSKEWPLTDPIGLKAVVKEYVLGSGKVPGIELKPPEFDPSKFMTNMVDRTLPDKSSGKGGGQGTFKDDGTVPPPVVPPKKPEPKKADAKPGKKGAPPKAGKSGSPDPKAAKDQSSTKILQAAAKDLKALQGKGPYSRAALDDQLKSIKQKTSGISFDVQSKGDNWLVTPAAGSSRGKGLAIKAKDLKDAPKSAKAGKYDGQVGKLVRFTAGKESHRLWIVANPSRVVVMMASAEKPVSEQLDDLEALAQQTGGNAKAAVTPLIAKARLRVAEVVKAAAILNGDLSKPTTNPGDIADEDTAVENEEDRLATIIGQILTALAAAMSPGPDYPMASAPGIGDIERHGEQDRRIRTGPQIWQTESEHILPFATGRSLWQALALYLPERNWPEDNQQTTIVIYERAARIKTTVDNDVSRHFASGVDNLHIATQLKALLGRYQQGDSAAFSEARSVMNTILSALNRAKEHAVERTVSAIAQENAETEAGFAKTNRERRALPGHVEPPKPSQADVARAAKRQYDDVIGLVTREVVSKEELRNRVARMLSRE